MTTSFRRTSVLFLLAAFVLHTQTETPWSTESDADEEEEKKQNVLVGSEETSRSTTLSEDTPSDRSDSEDTLMSGDENNLFNSNLTDYDDLQESRKSESSPENSFDAKVNDFVREGLETEDGFNGSSSGSFLFNDTYFPTVPFPTVEDLVSFAPSNCTFGARKCKPSKVVPLEDMDSKPRQKVIPTPTPAFSSSPLWNIAKSIQSLRDDFTRLRSFGFTSSRPQVLATMTSSPAPSSIEETSENVILIDNVEVDKGDSLVQGDFSKNEKPKPPKDVVSLSELADERLQRTIVKSATTPSMYIPKETVTVSNFNPLSLTLHSEFTPVSSLVFPRVSLNTRTLNSSQSLQRSFITKVDQPTNSLQLEKYIQHSSVDNEKMSRELISTALNALPTAPWYDKSNVTAIDNKPTKQYKDETTETTLISSSFEESPTPVITSSTNGLTISETKTFFSTYDTSTPALRPDTDNELVVEEGTTSTSRKHDLDPIPRLTNPSCSSLPKCVEVTLLQTSWQEFCSQASDFQEFLSRVVSKYTQQVKAHHIVLDAEVCSKISSIRPPQSTPDVTVAFYVTDESGEYEEKLTEVCGFILRKWAPTAYRNSILEIRLFDGEVQPTSLPAIPELNSGFVAAVSISAVAGVALCLLCILLIVMKQKLTQGLSSDTTPPTADAYSLDSLSISASFRRRRARRSARSYLNHAFNDQEIPSHPLSEKSLSNCLKNKDILEEEFKKIPMNMPKLDSIPEGAHSKNRYSNILPRPESRVVLGEPSGDDIKGYINANYVKGYAGKSSFYIACQAPLPEGIEDFWRMVWEQQSRVIVMLTMFEENGVSRCAVYFPQSTLITQPAFGDFQVTLMKKDVYEFYTMSTLRLLDIEKNLFRDIVHLWFTSWPDVGVPKDPSSLITFVQQCRSLINRNTGPTIVHCSTGTGRSGVFLALDICMREYDESRSIDILQCISQLRRDRGGAVQNKDQYILIHEAMHEYVSRIANQSQRPSISSKTP